MHKGCDTKGAGRTGVGGGTTLHFHLPINHSPLKISRAYQAFPSNPAEECTLVVPPAEPATRVR
ncbi:hypothetical protein BOTCAL_0220g00120 [Botryotinia calthae]|uniref:Uncharacterized protein n=1 Tax=Botryotinia calthae TaxID=38488 RepID=A0A4Y8CYG9_9HELO|nr:hypothetical protein BOTCAL_0220g00120 [Botryotinia calthae]